MSLPTVSFEFFPPRTPQGEANLWETVDRLAPLAPRFVSVTYGAGGSTQDTTLEITRRIAAETELAVAGHLTCVGTSRAHVDDVIAAYWAAGVRHVVALRGDMPELGAPFVAHPDGYASSPELVAAVRAAAPFEVSVSAYPEVHPDSRTATDDLELLRAKVAAGASRAITQFCFLPEAYVTLRDAIDAAGIDVPLVAGIMPPTNFAGITRMAERCGATIPPWLAERFDGLEDQPETRNLIAAMVTANLIEDLRYEGFDQFHIYTLNQAAVAEAVCRHLGLPARVPEEQAA